MDKRSSIARALDVLHPSRYNVQSQASNLDPANNNNKQRFSPLLLEHGERELQDWAIVASSSSLRRLKHGMSMSDKSRNGNSVGNSDGSVGSKKTILATSSRSLNSKSSVSTSSTSTSTRSRSSKTSKNRNGKRSHLLEGTNMKSIKGRLYLCSKSIVFEPTDVSRGIIRCPFDKMNYEPSSLSNGNVNIPPYNDRAGAGQGAGQGNEKDHSNTITFATERFLVMKKNNIIAPFETIETSTLFKFTFLHSSPHQFLQLSSQLYQISCKKNTSVSDENQLSLESLIKPMLGKKMLFDPCNLVHMNEIPKTPNLSTHLLGPLVKHPGCTIVTQERIYFQSLNGVFSTGANRALSWKLGDIVATARRYHGLKDSALEIYFNDGCSNSSEMGNSMPSVLLAFEGQREREQVMQLIPKVRSLEDCSGNKTEAKVFCHTDKSFLKQVVKAWMEGKIDNFEYLLALNSAAGRSFHDLSRYPVFPWVLADYESSKLDWSHATLHNVNKYGNNSEANVSKATSKMFRDLRKPVGALNVERLEQFQSRLKSMQDMEDSFLYGTHYSAPGYCLYYLVRLMPEQMLCLQNGKYDSPDRLFHSVDHSFASILTNPADLKELIPQFFDPKSGVDLLLNLSRLQLGMTQNGLIINDVQLPKWAKSPKDFLKKNRKALESQVCTQYLPCWIDLIFGEKARGDKAREAMNLFHPTSYLGPKDIDRMELEEEKMQAELQATEFGICPDVLFCSPHPLKSKNLDVIQDGLFVTDNGRMMDVNDDGVTDTFERRDRGSWEILSSPKPPETTTSNDSGRYGNDIRMSQNSNNKIATQTFKRESSKSPTPWVSHQQTDSDDGKLPTEAKQYLEQSSSNEDEQLYIAKSIVESEDSMKMKSLSFSGSGNTRGDEKGFGNGTFGVEPVQRRVNTQTKMTSKKSIDQALNTHQGWLLKNITIKQMHGDAVSGCHLAFNGNSNITTTSLDGGLMVHKLPSSETSHEFKRRSFSSASSIGHMSPAGKSYESNAQMFHSFRSHTSSDPLACLSVVEDKNGCQIAFAGGHDDVVLAYGVNAACGLASVYSHRDAVTGIDLLICPSFLKSGSHVMLSGSWDASVKIWSASITKSESVSIDREPLVELFDADTSVSDVSGLVKNDSILVAAGCTDGSLTVWSWNGRDVHILFKEEARRGYGPCSSVRWSSKTETGNTKDPLLFAGFGNGRVASYALKNDGMYPVGKLGIGSQVLCLSVVNNFIFAGCQDGGLRVISSVDGGHMDFEPRLFKSVNSKKSDSPPITCLSVVKVDSQPSVTERYMCATGGKDGSVALSYLEESLLM